MYISTWNISGSHGEYKIECGSAMVYTPIILHFWKLSEDQIVRRVHGYLDSI